MEAAARLKTTRFPVWTLAICAGTALVYSLPPLAAILIYDRTAIADGELWRLVTGNLVHYSTGHLGYDLLAFLVAGIIIETNGYRHYPLLCLTAAAGIGMVLYWGEPAMFYYAGLSGVATAAVVYLCLHGLIEKGAWQWMCVAALLGLGIKVAIEFTLDEPLLVAGGAKEFLPMPQSHLVGACVALFLFVLLYLRKRSMPQVSQS